MKPNEELIEAIELALQYLCGKDCRREHNESEIEAIIILTKAIKKDAR